MLRQNSTSQSVGGATVGHFRCTVDVETITPPSTMPKAALHLQDLARRRKARLYLVLWPHPLIRKHARLLDGDETLTLQAFEDLKRRRQQLAAFAVVPTPACDRRLDGGD